MLDSSQAVLEEMIDRLNERYGKITPLMVTQGDVHEYLGMTLDYSMPSKVTIQMDAYIRMLLKEAPKGMSGVAATPTGSRASP